VKKRVSSWGAPSIGSGTEALAGPDGQRPGRDWQYACSSLGSFSVVASALSGISHTGMEIYLEYSDARRGRQPVIVGIHSLDMPKPRTGERLNESGGIMHLQRLEGYGILEALHALLQILDLPLLLCQEEVFDALESFRHFLVECLYLLIQGLYILFAGHGALNHRGQAFNGFYFLSHMYSSIAGLAVVSMAGRDTGLAGQLVRLEEEGWPDTEVSRLSLACSAIDGQLATVGYSGPLMVQAHGSRRSPTSRPAQDGRIVSVLLGEA
jgi:hypothetical protein